MLSLILDIVTSGNAQVCTGGFICANETFIAIYGVIFTIVISLGVYIYGLQDKSEKITLTKNTDIKSVITSCLGFFAFSFLALPSPVYEFINFILVGGLILNLALAFKEVFKFNENELSGERAVKKFKEGVIQEKLKSFEEIKIKNDLLNKVLEEKRGDKEIERFLFDESNDSYYLIRAQSSGYVTNIDLNVLFTQELDQSSSKKVSYYIPYSISNGAPIKFDDVVLGIKKEEGKKVDETKLRSFISISEEFENPSSYLEAEIRSYYSEMFELIKKEDSKSLELKLKEFSSFVNNFTDKDESYVSIIQFINDDIVYPLQRYAFKQGDIDCIRKVVSFSLGYIYQSLNKKSIQTFNIFLRNFGHAFYESFKLNPKTRIDFNDAYFRWLNEVAKYSIKPGFQKDTGYIEFATAFLSSLNNSLRLAFDNKDLPTFSRTLNLLNSSFSRERHEYDEFKLLDEMILTKKAVIFGFAAWVYKSYEGRKSEDFYIAALSQLISSLNKDPVYYHGNLEDDLNYYVSVYLKTAEISESKGLFGWDSWGMPEGEVYIVTVRQDIKNLLADRILKFVIDKPDAVVTIKNQNYNDELSLVKEGNSQFDPLMNKNQQSFISTSNLTDEQFTAAKEKFYKIFSKITEKYEADVRTKLIEQSIDDSKFNKFAKENFESYETDRVMYQIEKFIKISEKKKDAFGYNILLNKEQFVAVTNVHYSNDNQFGEGLARSEDNKILESIYKKVEKDKQIKKDKIGSLVNQASDLSAVVIWSDGYRDIQDTNPENFKPYWQENNSRKDNGRYYQGSINGTPIYIVYKLKEFKSYPDTVFVLKQNAFSVNEFNIEHDEDVTGTDTKLIESDSNCLALSITNLSTNEDMRRKIVEKWIENNTCSITDKDTKIEELKTNVVFKFYKGLSTEDLVVDEAKLQVFHIK